MAREQRGATLAEVMIGLLVFSLLVLSILATLTQAARLESREEENTAISVLTQQIMEIRVDQARSFEGYRDLAAVPLSPTGDPDFLYQQEVVETTPGLKKLTVALYHADGNVIDTSRANGGRALTLSVVLGEPSP